MKENKKESDTTKLRELERELFKDLNKYKHIMVSGIAKKYNKDPEEIAAAYSRMEKAGLCFVKVHEKKKPGWDKTVREWLKNLERIGMSQEERKIVDIR